MTDAIQITANSFPGVNVPTGSWPIHSLELLLPGTFAPVLFVLLLFIEVMFMLCNIYMGLSHVVLNMD